MKMDSALKKKKKQVSKKANKKATSTKAKKPKLLQIGTGLHLDMNPYNMWVKELDEKGTKSEPLDRFRIFQSQVILRDQERGDSGLELIPGFAQWCLKYYSLLPRHGRNVHRWSSFNTKLSKKWDARMLSLATEVQRIPDDWSPEKLSNEHCFIGRSTTKKTKQGNHNDTNNNNNGGGSSKATAISEKKKKKKLEQEQEDSPDFEEEEESEDNEEAKEEPDDLNDINEVMNHIEALAKEHSKLPFVPCKEGDFIIWDVRAPHQNGVANKTNHNRQTFYHAYLVANDSINGDLAQSQRARRETGEHPRDFPKTWAMLEAQCGDSYKPYKLSALGKRLYGYERWPNNDHHSEDEQEELDQELEELFAKYPLSARHIAFFKRYGYVVVENAIPTSLTTKMREETRAFLLKHGEFDVDDPLAAAAGRTHPTQAHREEVEEGLWDFWRDARVVLVALHGGDTTASGPLCNHRSADASHVGQLDRGRLRDAPGKAASRKVVALRRQTEP